MKEYPAVLQEGSLLQVDVRCWRCYEQERKDHGIFLELVPYPVLESVRQSNFELELVQLLEMVPDFEVVLEQLSKMTFGRGEQELRLSQDLPYLKIELVLELPGNGPVLEIKTESVKTLKLGWKLEWNMGQDCLEK